MRMQHLTKAVKPLLAEIKWLSVVNRRCDSNKIGCCEFVGLICFKNRVSFVHDISARLSLTAQSASY